MITTAANWVIVAVILIILLGFAGLTGVVWIAAIAAAIIGNSYRAGHWLRHRDHPGEGPSWIGRWLLKARE